VGRSASGWRGEVGLAHGFLAGAEADGVWGVRVAGFGAGVFFCPGCGTGGNCLRLGREWSTGLGLEFACSGLFSVVSEPNPRDLLPGLPSYPW
jgi:hypothetical protein